MKFGGTSVANFEAITRTIFIIGGKLDQKPVVVVSALSKVTDLLYKISDSAAAGNAEEMEEQLAQLRERHVDLAGELLEQSPMLKEKAIAEVNGICDELDALARAVCAVKELSDRNKAIIISNGELLSSTVICFAMNAKGIKTAWIDARKMMVTNDSYLKGEPVVDEILARVPGAVAEAYQGMDAVITQGFIASNLQGKQTVLGRGGSDYSASLIGLASDAEKIEIWTDVDGVRSADPRKEHIHTDREIRCPDHWRTTFLEICNDFVLDVSPSGCSDNHSLEVFCKELIVCSEGCRSREVNAHALLRQDRICFSNGFAPACIFNSAGEDDLLDHLSHFSVSAY